MGCGFGSHHRPPHGLPAGLNIFLGAYTGIVVPAHGGHFGESPFFGPLDDPDPVHHREHAVVEKVGTGLNQFGAYASAVEEQHMFFVGHRHDGKGRAGIGSEAEGNLVHVDQFVEAVDGRRSRSALVVFDDRLEFDAVDSAFAVDLIHGGQKTLAHHLAIPGPGAGHGQDRPDPKFLGVRGLGG